MALDPVFTATLERTCMVPGCTRSIDKGGTSRAYCEMHRRRIDRHGCAGGNVRVTKRNPKGTRYVAALIRCLDGDPVPLPKGQDVL